MEHKLPIMTDGKILCRFCGHWRAYPAHGGYIDDDGVYYCGCRGVGLDKYRDAPPRVRTYRVGFNYSEGGYCTVLAQDDVQAHQMVNKALDEEGIEALPAISESIDTVFRDYSVDEPEETSNCQHQQDEDVDEPADSEDGSFYRRNYCIKCKVLLRSRYYDLADDHEQEVTVK